MTWDSFTQPISEILDMLIALRNVSRNQKIGPLAHDCPISNHANDVAHRRNRENPREADACHDKRNDRVPALQGELQLESDDAPRKDRKFREALYG